MAVKIVLNSSGIRKILQSRGVQRDLKRRADAIATAAGGGGFEPSVVRGRNRAHASVITTDHEAREAEADDRALTRSIDAGR